jgi:hypothetical protein
MVSKRCSNCKRKILIHILCKCEKEFCIECRFPELHSCGFDYKGDFQKKLEKENPIVVSEKLTKI